MEEAEPVQMKNLKKYNDYYWNYSLIEFKEFFNKEEIPYIGWYDVASDGKVFGLYVSDEKIGIFFDKNFYDVTRETKIFDEKQNNYSIQISSALQIRFNFNKRLARVGTFYPYDWFPNDTIIDLFLTVLNGNDSGKFFIEAFST